MLTVYMCQEHKYNSMHWHGKKTHWQSSLKTLQNIESKTCFKLVAGIETTIDKRSQHSNSCMRLPLEALPIIELSPSYHLKNQAVFYLYTSKENAVSVGFVLLSVSPFNLRSSSSLLSLIWMLFFSLMKLRWSKTETRWWTPWSHHTPVK